MPIDHGFILAAGLGTRMGVIGQQLPKVMWPIFETTLLGLQIDFLRQLQVKNLAVNSHHQHHKIEDYLKKFYPDIQVLYEPQLLDSGGGVHNYLSNHRYYGKHLLLNSDQFLVLPRDIVSQMSAKLEEAVLVTMPNPGDYGSIIQEDDRMIGIGEAAQGDMFTGFSLIDASKIAPVAGKSRYFESVANYQKYNVQVISTPFAFIDFGTLKKYWHGCFELFNRLQRDSDLKKIWVERGLIKSESMLKTSYDCEQDGVLNFSGAPLMHTWPRGSIILEESESARPHSDACVVYQDLCVAIA